MPAPHTQLAVATAWRLPVRGAALERWIAGKGAALNDRSRRFVRTLAPQMDKWITLWLLLFLSAAATRMVLSRAVIHDLGDWAQIALPYGLAALAPAAAYRLAMRAFAPRVLHTQPDYRLARYGRWRQINPVDARNHPVFGPFGFMASLLLGMLLNIPVRSFEFLVAVPAINHHAPAWAITIFHMMTLDLVIMNFLYAVCFVMALRSIPLFPRMLLLTWMVDIVLQLAIAQRVAASPGLPDAVGAALEQLLHGNITKVLISATIWLPYLLLSERVNVTYRSRIPA